MTALRKVAGALAKAIPAPRMSNLAPIRQQGVTLIELILSMVIIAVALTGVLSVMNLSVSHSADPLLQSQSIAIAESYLEEILLQAYADPSPIPGVEASRDLYDNVADYNGLNDVGVHDQLGNLISELNNFNVAVSVANVTVTGNSALEVTVTVTKAGVPNISLVGYRFAY